MFYQTPERLKERINSNIAINDETGCWEWQRRIQSNGYGSMWIGQDEEGRKVFTTPHRVSYQLYKGVIPKGMEIAHTCHNPGCCNPNHLVAATHQENMQMSVREGRLLRGEEKPNAKIDDLIVRTLRDGELRKILSLSQIARLYDVSVSTIRSVLQNRTWKHVQPLEC